MTYIPSDKQVQDALEMQYKNSMLCHYTTIEALCNMLSNIHNTENHGICIDFWASNIFAMNDIEEIMYGYDVLFELLPTVEKELHIDNKFKVSRIWDNYNKKTKGEWNTILKESLHSKAVSAYIISLTRKINSLDMWRTYTNNGEGVCIVFSKSELRGVNELKPCEVSYGKISDDSAEHKSLVDFYTEYYKDILKVTNNDKIIFDTKLSFLFNRTIAIAAYIKRSEFEYEQEERIVSWNKLNNNIYFRTTNHGNTIPYIKIPIPIRSIKKIILGPCIDGLKMKFTLEMILKSKNVNIEIEESNIPYRQY